MHKHTISVNGDAHRSRVRSFVLKFSEKSAVETEMFSHHKKKLMKVRRQRLPARQKQVAPANQEPVSAPEGAKFDTKDNPSSNRDAIVSFVLRHTMNTTHTHIHTLGHTSDT